MNATSPPFPATGETGKAPVDIATMRAAVRRLLARDAELPTREELGTLTLQLRGHIMLMVPEVEAVTSRLPEGDLRQACARVSVRAARQRLDLEPRPGLPAAIAHAQGLARAVGALCDHYETVAAL